MCANTRFEKMRKVVGAKWRYLCMLEGAFVKSDVVLEQSQLSRMRLAYSI